MVKEQMRQTHEDEVTSMITENEKLQGLLDMGRRKINDCENEIEQLKEALNQSKKYCPHMKKIGSLLKATNLAL